jgi:hypothetical protein
MISNGVPDALFTLIDAGKVNPDGVYQGPGEEVRRMSAQMCASVTYDSTAYDQCE